MPTLHDPIAFAIGPFGIRWYALFIVTGIFGAMLLASRLARKRAEDPEFIFDMAPFVVLGSIAAARLYYVLLEWKRFRHDPLDALNIRGGGLSIHGAIIAGILIVWLMARWRGHNVWTWLDILAPALAFGQAIGRWGNWANQEAFGKPTDLPWAVTIDPSRRPAGYEASATFHPTFLYESILDLLLCWTLIWVVLHGPFTRWYRPGRGVALYLVAYGLIRLIVESLRTDSLYIGPLPAAYWLSGLLIVLGTAIWLARRPTDMPTARPTATDILQPGEL